MDIETFIKSRGRHALVRFHANRLSRKERKRLPMRRASRAMTQRGSRAVRVGNASEAMKSGSRMRIGEREFYRIACGWMTDNLWYLEGIARLIRARFLCASREWKALMPPALRRDVPVL